MEQESYEKCPKYRQNNIANIYLYNINPAYAIKGCTHYNKV